MNRRTVLFLMNSDTSDAMISAAAEAAAAQQNHLSCLLLAAAPVLPMNAYGALPYGGISVSDNWGEQLAEAQTRQQERVDATEALLARSNVSGDVRSVICATVDIKRAVSLSARVSDEAVIAANLRDTKDIMREAVYGVLFHSPIGLRLNGSASQEMGRIFVAWDSSEAAAAAVHAALPYLKDAQEVVIGCFDPVMTAEENGQDPGTAVAAWLSHHGCKVTVSQFPSGGRALSRCIQDRAQEFGADLVVMGGYGHARILEAVFGGTTRSMIEQTVLPVLLAH